MDKLLKEYLETAYGSPFDVKLQTERNYKSIKVFCKEECIARGEIVEGENYTFISWSIPYDTWNKMNNYIPAVNPNDYKDIVSWVTKKCKKQGISLLGQTYYNLK